MKGTYIAILNRNFSEGAWVHHYEIDNWDQRLDEEHDKDGSTSCSHLGHHYLFGMSGVTGYIELHSSFTNFVHESAPFCSFLLCCSRKRLKRDQRSSGTILWYETDLDLVGPS